MSAPQLVTTAHSLSADGVEFLDAFLYAPGTVRDHLPSSEKIRAFVEEAKSALDSTGLRVHAISVTNDFDHEDLARLHIERDKIKLGIDLAEELGAPAVRVFAGNPTSSEGIELVRYRTIDALKALETPNVKLCLENHGNVFSTPARLNSILEPLAERNVGLCFDIGNFLLAGVDAVTAATELQAPSLIHVKDFRHDDNGPYLSASRGNVASQKFAGCPLGEGVVPLVETLHALLTKTDPSVPIDLELESGQDGLETVRQALVWLRQTLSEFQVLDQGK
jgi:sugar phosphate isomerase/epimerase